MRASILVIGLVLCAAIVAAGCTSTETTQTQARPNAQEIKIAQYYHDQLWADIDVPEEQVRSEVADHFGISEVELDDIYVKAITYNKLETTGTGIYL